jgi:hypothetical protein
MKEGRQANQTEKRKEKREKRKEKTGIHWVELTRKTVKPSQ